MALDGIRGARFGDSVGKEGTEYLQVVELPQRKGNRD